MQCNVMFLIVMLCPAVPPQLRGGGQHKNGTPHKVFPALCAGLCAPNFKSVSAPVGWVTTLLLLRLMMMMLMMTTAARCSADIYRAG